MDDDPNMLVRILCGHLFHRTCISNAFLAASLCPLCACVPKKNYQWPQPYPLSWDGDDEEDGAAGAEEQLLLEVLRVSVILELKELQVVVERLDWLQEVVKLSERLELTKRRRRLSYRQQRRRWCHLLMRMNPCKG